MLKFENVKKYPSRSHSDVVFGPFSFEFKVPGMYYVRGNKNMVKVLKHLILRKTIPDFGSLTYKGEKLSVYETTNRSYEDIIFTDGIKYINSLTVLDNYLCELFKIYQNKDVALDIIESFYDKLPQNFDMSVKYNDLSEVQKATTELFSVNFFEYQIIVLDDPLPHNIRALPQLYARMLEKFRKDKLILILNQNEVFDEVELLGGYSDSNIKIDEIGEIIDEEE